MDSKNSVEEELGQCVVQVRAGYGTETTKGVQYNEYEVENAQLFEAEKCLAGNYALL